MFDSRGAKSSAPFQRKNYSDTILDSKEDFTQGTTAMLWGVRGRLQ